MPWFGPWTVDAGEGRRSATASRWQAVADRDGNNAGQFTQPFNQGETLGNGMPLSERPAVSTLSGWNPMFWF